MRANIGNVMVFSSALGTINPYASAHVSITGEERVMALTCFKHGALNARFYTFWNCPAEGGARKLTSPNDINWATSTIV